MLVNPTRLAVEHLLPASELFANQSSRHGVAHVARVMIHGFLLVEMTGHREAGVPLWAAVFTHDLARTGDGICHRHGPAAAERLRSSASLREMLLAGGLAAADLEAVCVAVHTHSHGELPPEHPHATLTALLKDADGLDRVRLGDLDPAYFRFPEAHALVDFSYRLFTDTNPWPTTDPDYMSRVWTRAAELLAETDPQDHRQVV